VSGSTVTRVVRSERPEQGTNRTRITFVQTDTRPERALVVNGEPRTSRAATLATLLDEMGFAGQKIATAVNGAFVPERARAGHALGAGDEIEIVSPRQGG
jgi:sulfur carrier protein